MKRAENCRGEVGAGLTLGFALQIDAWAQSNSIPGQFTGSTGAQILSSDELTNSGPQAWIRKVEVTQALLPQQHTPQHSRIATCVAQHVPSAAGWAQTLPWLSLRCGSALRCDTAWHWHCQDTAVLPVQSPQCPTGTQQAGFGPAALEITGFWYLLQRAKSQTALSLILCACSFASLWITRVLWEPEMCRIKEELQLMSSSVMLLDTVQ